MKPVRLLLIVLILLILSGANSVSAEPWIDLFVGAAIPRDRDIEDKSSLGVTFSVRDVEFDRSVSFGGRLGWWTNSLPWLGLAVDAFHFSPDVNRQTRTATILGQALTGGVEAIDIGVTVIGLNLMARAPLSVSSEFKNGRVQPYVGAGPAVFITNVNDKGNFNPSDQDERDTSIGLDAKAGLKIFLNKTVAVFG